MAELFLGGMWDHENGFQCLEMVSAYPPDLIERIENGKAGQADKARGALFQLSWIRNCRKVIQRRKGQMAYGNKDLSSM